MERFPRDTNRPRINEPDSRLDREQKTAGEYYYALAAGAPPRDRRHRKKPPIPATAVAIAT